MAGREHVTWSVTALVAAIAISASTALAALTTHQLVLQQGYAPTIDGVGVGSTYTGAVDTYVDHAQPGSSFYSDPTVRFGLKNPSGSATETRGYLRFDSFDQYIPSNAYILGAKVKLVSAGDEGGANYQSYVRYRTTSFGDSITWNTAGTRVGNSTALGTAGGWNQAWAVNNVQTLDITALAQQWHTGGVGNNGLYFVGQEDSSWTGVGHQFYSSDYVGDTTKRPTLQVNYVAPGIVTQGGNVYTSAIAALRGPSVMQDTYVDIANPNTNYASAQEVNYSSWWGGSPTKRGLMKVDMTNPTLASIVKTGEGASNFRPLLAGAYLQLWTHDAGPGYFIDVYTISSMSPDWTVAGATGNTRDGVNAWPQSMLANFPGNLSQFIGRVSMDSFMTGASMTFDITSILQGYIDGTLPNFGFFIGQNDQGLQNLGGMTGLSESLTGWYQPTLVLELLYTPEPATAGLLGLGGLAALLGRRRGN